MAELGAAEQESCAGKEHRNSQEAGERQPPLPHRAGGDRDIGSPGLLSTRPPRPLSYAAGHGGSRGSGAE